MKPKIANHYRLEWEQHSNTHVLLFPEGLAELNQTAAEILKHCDGSRTIDEICDIIQSEFGAPEARSDVGEFLKKAYELGWITNST